MAPLHPRRTPTFHPRRPGTPHLRGLAGFFVWMDFGPALRSIRGRYKTAIAVRAAAFVARDLCVVAPPSRETPTSHPRRPDVPYGLVSASVCSTDGLRPRYLACGAGMHGYCRTYALLRLSRTRTIYWLGRACWPAGLSGSFGDAGLPTLRKIRHHC